MTPEGTVNVAGDGTYSSPDSVLATQVGTYTWHAHYSGDLNNSPADDNGASEGVIIVQAGPAINTAASVTAGGVVGTAVLTDNATLTGGYVPGGTISFSLTSPGGTTTPEGTVNVAGDGTYSSPDSVLATQVGTYTWHAHYSGDLNNSPADDNGASEGVIIVQAGPAINTTASVTAGGVVGSALLTDNATLSGGYLPGGTISFSLTSPGGTTTPEGTVNVAGDGTYGSPDSVLATQVGTYTWHAHYSGDLNNSPADDNGASEGVIIVQAGPAINTAASVTAGGVVGTALLTDNATLTGGYLPGGTISFSLTAPGGTTTPEGTVNVTGDATYPSPNSVLATQVGTYTWHAHYSGDVNNGAAD